MKLIVTLTDNGVELKTILLATPGKFPFATLGQAIVPDGITLITNDGTLSVAGDPRLTVYPLSFVTAAGTDQATATELADNITVITAGAEGTGVLLASGFGLTMNRTGKIMRLYPPESSQIEGLELNAPYLLGPSEDAFTLFNPQAPTQGYLTSVLNSLPLWISQNGTLLEVTTNLVLGPQHAGLTLICSNPVTISGTFAGVGGVGFNTTVINRSGGSVVIGGMVNANNATQLNNGGTAFVRAISWSQGSQLTWTGDNTT